MNREQRRAAEKESRRQNKKKKRIANSFAEVVKQLAAKRMLEKIKEMEEENETTIKDN